MSEERKPEHSIFTYTGTRFWPLQPKAEEVNIVDIAHALSNQGRFTGHTREFYSVAQHSVLCSRLVAPEFALWALLHDATEAYLIDLARPVKTQMPEFKRIENILMEVIAQKFDLPMPMPQAVHDIDNQMLMTEKRDLMPRSGDFNVIHSNGATPLAMTIEPWSPKVSKAQFLGRYHELTTAMPIEFQACSLEGGCGCDEDLALHSTILIAEDFANRKDI